MRTRDENKIESIYKEALDMIVTEGFEGLSMQKLAKAAGVSPATIYIYFKDKEDLILQLHRRELARYFDYLLDGFDPKMDFASGLAFQWRRRADYAIDNPNPSHFLEHFKFTPFIQKFDSEIHGRFSDVMQAFVSNAIANKELVAMPFDVYWSVAFAPLYNLVRYHKAGVSLAGRKFELTDQVLQQTLSLVLKGLKP